MRTLILVPMAFALAAALTGCGEDAKGCVETGGTAITLQCCPSAPDFPNTCVPGPCGCDPALGVPRRVCDCPAGRCFDGTRCR